MTLKPFWLALWLPDSYCFNEVQVLVKIHLLKFLKSLKILKIQKIFHFDSELYHLCICHEKISNNILFIKILVIYLAIITGIPTEAKRIEQNRINVWHVWKKYCAESFTLVFLLFLLLLFYHTWWCSKVKLVCGQNTI